MRIDKFRVSIPDDWYREAYEYENTYDFLSKEDYYELYEDNDCY